ncbi:MAG: DinB family protein [Actinomycetota bacterium]|nr:DinB family protein [Actinomycetota bacterium]
MSQQSNESNALLASLTAQRRHVLGILDGLPEEDLRRSVLPSGWTCLGLVQHLALDVEQFWFRAVVAGDPAVIESDGPENAWQVAADVPVETVFDLYRTEIERADAILTATAIDAAPAWWPGDLFGDFRMHELRQVVLHVIGETACHAGHLDVVRELLDGRRWMVLTG